MKNTNLPIKLKAIYTNYKKNIVLRNSGNELWDNVIKNIEYVPVHYTSSYIDYQHEYHKGNFKKYIDISLILINNEKSIAVWPLSLGINQDGDYLVDSFGVPVLKPLIIMGVTKKQDKLTFSIAFEIFNEILETFKIKKWKSLDFMNHSKGFSYWFRLISNKSQKIEIDYALFLEIKSDINLIKKSLRKSYKSLINLDQKKFNIKILDFKDYKKWEEYRKLHIKTAKRETRDKKTWDIQFSHILSNDSFLIYIEDEKNKLIGGGYYNCSKDECFYSIGVFDKEYLEINLGHVINYYAIIEMIKRKIKWFKLGHTKINYNEKEKKLESISKFKLGFTSNIFPEFIISYNNVSRKS